MWKLPCEDSLRHGQDNVEEMNMDNTEAKDTGIFRNAGNCKMCKGLLPIHGGHIITLDDIIMKVCEVCFKNVVNVCIDKMHRGLHNG